MSRDEIESRARPPSIRTGRQPRSSGSVRGTADRKAAGYDNPLYTAGDVLSDRDAADVMPVVVGDHVVVTPRQPESPLVAKLKAQAADKSQRLRQDRILNSTVTSSTASNPFFPASPLSPRPAAPSDADRPRSCRVRPSSHSLADPRFRPSHAQPRFEAVQSRNVDDGDDDAESLDSIVLDESPCPLRMATPGGALRVGAFGGAFGAPSLDSMPSSPNSAAVGIDSSEAQQDDADAGSDGAASHGAEASAVIAPQDSPIPAAGSDAADLAAAAADATRPETPTQDCELLKLIKEDIPRFVHTPGPLLEPLKCYIVREKASGGLLTKAPHCYKLYLEDRDTFLLAARRRERTKCPSYVVSLDETELSRSSSSYCGKIKSNFIGTEFQILDGGERVARRPSPLKRQGSFLGGPRHQLPSAAQGASTETAEGRAGSPEDGGRSELGLVQYHMNVMGTKGPRKMVIGVPYVDFDSNVPMKWTGGTRMARLKRETHDESEMIRLVNKVPKWNSTLGAYCLNFNGRVTQASVKNFQLVSEGDEQEREVLQFGRVAENRFTMDFAWPLTAYQAFCICITSLDSKLACE